MRKYVWNNFEGFIVYGQENKVCKVVKSMYGLKQTSKGWHEKFDNATMSLQVAVTS